MSDVGIVVIGRNEGERLRRCLDSLAGRRIVYVDSGSTDGSVELARASGAEVVPLDMERPFTAARARNAGAARLPPACRFVQFVDGDCSVQPGWIDHARAAFDADDRLAAVSGRRRESAPGASVYNWLCDLEWAAPAGPAGYFGGDVMLRREALAAAGGYPTEMIAGEEPDLAIRMRALGWTIRRLPDEMTLHDAAIHRFGQWWRRARRSGHAYAELAERHRGSALSDYGRRSRGVLFWGLGLPALAAALSLVAAATGRWGPARGAGVLSLLALAQLARLAMREWRRRPLREATMLAVFLMLAKPAQALGFLSYWRGRLSGRRNRLIEYKGVEA